jgi:hypothetical protein
MAGNLGQMMFAPSSKRWLQGWRGWFTSFALEQASASAMS